MEFIKKLIYIFISKILHLINYERIHTKLSRKKSPDFIIAGAMKSGTTSLYQYLSSHPDLIASTIKEPSFFCWRHSIGVKKYLSYFPRKKDVSGKLVFEATPTYLHHPKAPKRIKRILPNTKLIMIIRDPIERAISHYNYYSSLTSNYAKKNPHSIERKNITEAFCDDINKRTKAWNKQYCRFSLYGKQLQAFYELINSKNILVLDFEELKKNPHIILSKISEFLGIDYSYFSSFKKTNTKIASIKSFNVDVKTEINIYNAQEYSINLPKDLENKLISFYKKDVRLLMKLAKMNFSWSEKYLKKKKSLS